MAKTVVIIGTLDTKGTEFAFIKDLIEKEGLKTLVVDFGVMGEPAFKPDIPRDEVAGAGGGNLAAFSFRRAQRRGHEDHGGRAGRGCPQTS